MEFPRELWEGQNVKTVAHKYVNIDVDPFGEKTTSIAMSSLSKGRGGGVIKAFTEHLSPCVNVSNCMLHMIICSSTQVMITEEYCPGGMSCEAHPGGPRHPSPLPSRALQHV